MFIMYINEKKKAHEPKLYIQQQQKKNSSIEYLTDYMAAIRVYTWLGFPIDIGFTAFDKRIVENFKLKRFFDTKNK